jgi:hypothetical protein
MDRPHLYLQHSRSRVRYADKLLNLTYPIVKNEKIFLPALNNIFLAFSHLMSAFLYRHLMKSEEDVFSKLEEMNFSCKLKLFKKCYSTQNKLNSVYLNVLNEMKEILLKYHKSNVVFLRKEKIVICDLNYNYKTISIEDVKRYLHYTRLFSYIIEELLLYDMKSFNTEMTKVRQEC